MLQNTEGDPLVLCEVTLRVEDPAALVRHHEGHEAKLTVVNDSRQPASAAAADAGTVSPESAGLEVAAALDQFVRDYEQKWLDESIPALAGYTPRQAAADPTRRGDLIRLLDSFPVERGKPGVMDVDRLRAALGLG